MRAVTVSEYGAIPVVGEIPTPEPGAGQVLLRMRAAGMNPMDGTLASGAWRPAPATFPMVLGADGAGVVEGSGEGARRFFRGDELSPITRITLEQAPAALDPAQTGRAEGKTVITL